MRILFSTIFLISLFVFTISRFEDWLIVTLIIQAIWLNFNSNLILKRSYNNHVWTDRIITFNKITLYVLVVDLLIIFLSMSFFVRILLAPFYQGLFILTSLLIFISAILNYSVLINHLMKMPISKIKQMVLVVASFFYPIGIFVINFNTDENIN